MTTAPHRRNLPTIRSLSRRPAANVVPLPSPPPDSIIAWAWYVNGVRKAADDLSVAARLANAGEGFVWLGLKDPSDEDLMALASQFDLHPLRSRTRHMAIPVPSWRCLATISSW